MEQEAKASDGMMNLLAQPQLFTSLFVAQLALLLPYLGGINLLKVLCDINHPLCNLVLVQEAARKATGDD
jgi:hypothetical protein